MNTAFSRGLAATVVLALGAQAALAATASKTSAPSHATSATHASAGAAGGASASRMARIQAKGEEASAAMRMKYEPRIAALAQEVDVEWRKNPASLSERFAKEFGLSAEVLAREQKMAGEAWGDLMIAHTLSANAHPPLSAAQAFQLHKDGMGWTMVAYGLGLDMDQVASAVEAENRVATGETSPDGKVKPIRGATATNTSLNESR